MVVLPPLIDEIALARKPPVVTDPPRIEVVPPLSVATPSASSPLVEIFVSVRESAPPVAKLPEGPL